MKFFNKLANTFISTVKIVYGAFFIAFLILSCTSQKSFSQFKLNEIKLHESADNINSDTVPKKSNANTVFKMKKDPWKAVLYSALLPGAGQVYNKSYWKVPVIAGLGGYFVYEYVRNNNKFIEYKDLYQNSQNTGNPSGDPQLLALREFYRDQRDNFIIYSVILYVVNLIDAYVDAQLYDFDVSEKIKISFLNKNNMVKLSYGF